MQHPNTGQAAGSPRLRPNRAPSSPALGGAGGLPPDLIVRIPAIPDSAAGRIARRQIAYQVDRLIQLLDALEAPMEDMEDSEEDCCPAGDDDPASSFPFGTEHMKQCRKLGDELDAEHSDEGEPNLGWTLDGQLGSAADDDREHDDADDEAETDQCQADDPSFPKHQPVQVQRDPCCLGPLQLNSREWGYVRSAR